MFNHTDKTPAHSPIPHFYRFWVDCQIAISATE